MTKDTHPRSGQANVTEQTIREMFNFWRIDVLMLIVPVIVSIFVDNTWILSMVVFVEAWMLSLKKNFLSDSVSVAVCKRLDHVVVVSLIWTAVVMTVINLLYNPSLFGGILSAESLGVKKMIISMVVFPVTSVTSAYALIMGLDLSTCRKCQDVNGHYSRGDMMSNLYFRESSLQLRLLLYLSLFMTVVEYGYYAIEYNNEWFNQADRYFFEIIPVIVYLFSLLYFSRRYDMRRIRAAYREEIKELSQMSTVHRTLLVHDNSVLIRKNGDGFLDTPIVSVCDFSNDPEPDITKSEKRKIENLGISLDNATEKYLYTTPGYAGRGNEVHCAVILDPEQEVPVPEGCAWANAAMIDQAAQNGLISKQLNSELFRIHTITMAWKTYTPEGKRRYPIKHYRPTFRIKDLGKWNVDYNDLNWLYIASNNEDSVCYRLRNVLNRLTGVGKWK